MMISMHHLYDILLFVIGALFWLVEVKKNGFLSQVDILKWEKLKIAQEITSRLHYRGLLLLKYRREIYLIVKVNQEKKVCNFVFFFLQINYVWGSGCLIERIKLNDRLNKDIRLHPLCENTFSSLIYTRNLIELLKIFLFSHLLHVTLRKSLDGS